jgi:hypothetical protein
MAWRGVGDGCPAWTSPCSLDAGAAKATLKTMTTTGEDDDDEDDEDDNDDESEL